MLYLLPGIDAPPVEALWKQEGENRGANLRKAEWGSSGIKSTKPLTIRNKKKLCAIVRSSIVDTHNLKVRGSNPPPATKLRRQVKYLAASIFLAFISTRIQEALWEQEGA
jgi:hypothetical protein